MKSSSRKALASVIVGIVGFVTIIGLSDLIFLIPKDVSNNDNQKIFTVEKIQLTTRDKKEIAGDYYQIQNPKGWVLYLHMMPATKESYSNLAEKLAKEGYAGLAIDFSGHGQSDGGPDGYQDFSDADHQKNYDDILAAVDFLKSQGAKDENISLIGASIGANLALKYFASNLAIDKLVLLSVGLDYRGVVAKDFAVTIGEGRKILMVSSKDDGENVKWSEEIYSLISTETDKKIVILENAGHGTNMFSNLELYDTIIKFIIK